MVHEAKHTKETFCQMQSRLSACADDEIQYTKSRQLLARVFDHTLHLAFIIFNKLSLFRTAPEEGLPKYLHLQWLLLDVTQGSSLYVSGRACGA